MAKTQIIHDLMYLGHHSCHFCGHISSTCGLLACPCGLHLGTLHHWDSLKVTLPFYSVTL